MEFKSGRIVEIISEKEFGKFKLSDSYKKLSSKVIHFIRIDISHIENKNLWGKKVKVIGKSKFVDNILVKIDDDKTDIVKYLLKDNFSKKINILLKI